MRLRWRLEKDTWVTEYSGWKLEILRQSNFVRCTHITVNDVRLLLASELLEWLYNIPIPRAKLKSL